MKCNEDDTVGDLKKLIAAQTGTASYVTQEHPILTWQGQDSAKEMVHNLQGPHYIVLVVRELSNV